MQTKKHWLKPQFNKPLFYKKIHRWDVNGFGNWPEARRATGSIYIWPVWLYMFDSETRKCLPPGPPSPTFLLTAHLLPNRVTVMDPQRPSVWNFCGWRRRPRPGHNKLLTKQNLCYRMGACDITSSPGAVWDLGQTQALCVSRARAPCTRVLDHPAMSPLLSTGLDASWHSHAVR